MFCLRWGARLLNGAWVRGNGVLAVTARAVCPAEREDKSWGEGREAPDQRDAASLLMWGGGNEPCVSREERTRWKWWRRRGRESQGAQDRDRRLLPRKPLQERLGSGWKLLPDIWLWTGGTDSKDNQKHMWACLCLVCGNVTKEIRHAEADEIVFHKTKKPTKKRERF